MSETFINIPITVQDIVVEYPGTNAETAQKILKAITDRYISRSGRARLISEAVEKLKEGEFVPAHRCEECGEVMSSTWKVEGGKKIGGVCTRCERELCGECGDWDSESNLCKRCREIEAKEHDDPEESIHDLTEVEAAFTHAMEEKGKLSLRTRLEAAEWRYKVFLENERNNRENFGKGTVYKKIVNEGGEEVRIGACIGEGIKCVDICISGYPTLKIPIWLFPVLGEALDVMRGSAGEPLPVGWEEAE